ncbi:MAG: GNAT family N-acetyltransferase [Pseudomonadota bacterium]|nr:GNAT family N-acetyltransferase [Pseudomonadota bacterium]
MDIIKSERITLREINDEDVNVLAGVLSDPIVMKYSIVGALNKSQIIAYIIKCKEDYKAKGYGNWLVYSNDSKKFIGICGLNTHKVDGKDILHINYRLCTSQQGNGYAFEAIEAVKKYSKCKLNIDTLHALIDSDNSSSVKVAKKCGFSFVKPTSVEGFNVDLYINDSSAKYNNYFNPTANTRAEI